MRLSELRLRHKLIALFVMAVIFGTTAGVALGTAEEPRPAIGVYPSDTDGDGVISDSGDERFPELIQAAGDNGVLGYVRLEDMEGPQPSTHRWPARNSVSTRDPISRKPAISSAVQRPFSTHASSSSSSCFSTSH